MAVHTQESQARLPIKPAASVKLPVQALGYQLLNQQKPMQLGLDLSSYKCQNQSKLSSSKVDAPTLHTGMMRMVLHTTVTGILKVRTVQFMAVHTQESQARLPIKPAASVKLPVQAQVDPVPTPLGYQLLNQQKAHGHLLPPRLGGQLLNRQMVQLCFQHRLSVDPVLVLGYQLLNQQKPMQLGLDLSSYKC